MDRDERYMRRALELAACGRGLVEPNPLVGAVIVRDETVVGEGYHERYGGPHAEVHAIGQAGGRSRGATLYVSLEPCSHFGKTPPCADAVIAAGIARVVAAMCDPNERVAGQGIERLRAAGLTVDVGLLESDARSLNGPYLKLVATGLPYVHAKWAMTLDGKIATATGESKWITGDAARAAAHEIRGRMDAIVVGIGTVLADDPLLTARPPGPRVATRIVLDSAGRLPCDSQLVRTARQVPVLVATSSRAPAMNLTKLRDLGCECLELPSDERGVSVRSLLTELGRRRMTNLLIEGGSQTLGSFHDAGAVDEQHVYVAAKTFGGDGLSPVAGKGLARIDQANSFEVVEVRQFGMDCLIHTRRVVS